MKDLLVQDELTVEQAAVIARAMWKVALAEAGVHEAEQQMIDGFYHGVCEAAGIEPDDLATRPYDPTEARRLLRSLASRELLLRSCYLLTFVDGQCSPSEEEAVRQLSDALAITRDQLDEIRWDVQRGLFAQFADLTVFASTRYEIGAQLGMSAEEVDALMGETP